MADWFYVESGGAVGPLSRIELEAAVRAGRVTPDTLVCEDGQDEWRLARRVSGLVPPRNLKAWQASVTAASRYVPPPPPPRVPVPAPAPAREPKRPYFAPNATLTEAVPDRAPSAIRRHAVLAGVVGLAAVGGGILGAWLVLRMARQEAPAAPAALAMVAPSREAGPAREGAKLRPTLPPAPTTLPEGAQVIVEERLERLRAAMAGQEAATGEFLAGGGLDAATLTSREDIATRLQQLDDLRARNEALRRELSALPDQVRAAVAEAGLAPEVADAASRRAKAEAAPWTRAREADAEMQDVGGEALSLLEQSFGTWSVRRAERVVEFSAAAAPEAAARYARLVEDAAGIASR